MHEVTEGKPAQLDFFLDTESATLPDDIICRLKGPGSQSWREKKLDLLSWKNVEHGVYVLTLEPIDIGHDRQLSVLIAARPGSQLSFAPIMRTVVIVPDKLRAPSSELSRTLLFGRIVTASGQPKIKVPVTFRITQPPMTIAGLAISAEMITVETDERGAFEAELLTGLNLSVQIPAVNYSRVIVVPPPPASGIPVCLFSI